MHSCAGLDSGKILLSSVMPVERCGHMANWNGQQEMTANDVFANALFILVAVAFGTWILWDAAFYRLVTFSSQAEYWEYTATLKEWLSNLSTPGNPHVDDTAQSARYMPYFWALSSAGLLFQLDAFQLMACSSVINYLLIIVGLHQFLSVYFRDAWAPLAGFFAVFLLWGVTLEGSNLYHLSSLFYIAGYPSSFVFGLSLISFSVVIKLLRSDGPLLLQAALLFVLSILMFLCHPFTAVFGIVGCILLTCTEPADSRNHRIGILILLLAGTLAAELWPYFSAWKILLGLYGSGAETAMLTEGSDALRMQLRSDFLYTPGQVVTYLGPTLLGLPLCFWLWRRREHSYIVWGVVLMGVPYLAYGFLQAPLGERFLLFLSFYLQLAIVWGILFLIEAWRSAPRPNYANYALTAMLAAAAVVVTLNVWQISLEFDGRTLDPRSMETVNRRDNLPNDMSVVDLYTELTAPLAEESVVLATAKTGWPLPSFKGKVVSVLKTNPLLTDQAERHQASGEFFYQPLPDSARSVIAQRYGATHVLLSFGDKGVERQLHSWLGEHARLSASVGHYRMYRLLSSAYAAAPDPLEAVTAKADVDAKSDLVGVAGGRSDDVRRVSLPATSARRDNAAPAENSNAGFGAPIASPIIESTAKKQEQEARESVSDELPAALLAPLHNPNEAQTEKPAAVPPEAFGAPIAAPVLDPERHGG